MRKKYIKNTLLLIILFFGHIQGNEIKQSLKSDYQLIFHKDIKTVENLSDMLKKGIFYKRVRSNSFLYHFEKEQKDSLNTSLGLSLTFQSALYKNFDLKTAFYYSYGFTNLSLDEAEYLKAASDLFDKRKFADTEDKDLAVLAQAYIRYSGINKSEIKVGRQLVETFYTRSNDTKMVPNTFDAIVFSTKTVPNTYITLGYLKKGKLRGDSHSHSLFVYDENDDSAMHKGITYEKLKDAGKSTDTPLIIADITNRSIENLTINTAYYNIEELISSAMIEGNYKIYINKEITVIPGIRYIKQFDDQAGMIGGAAYDGKPNGYKDPYSLDSRMLAAHFIAEYKNFKLNIGYSKVFDEADLITPWRGFPTAGYTRSMARYNWMANTKSYRIQLQINQNKTGIYKDLFVQTSILHTDADEDKGFYDENYYYLGFIQNIPSMLELQWRFRLGYQDT